MVDYLRPTELSDALAALAARDLTIVAGATDYYPAQVGRQPDHDILDLSALEILQGIARDGDYWRIGAMATWRDVLDADLPPCFEGLKVAARQLGGPQIQNAATVAGNLCNASPAADGIPPLLCLEAEVLLQNQAGSRRLLLSEFILGNRRTALMPGEMLTAILVPGSLQRGRAGFIKLGARSSLVISIVMVAGLLMLDEHGRVRDARLSVGACSEIAQRLPLLEAALRGQTPGPELVRPDHFAHLSPLDDHRGTAAYRLDAAATLTGRLLEALAA
ncbi:MAG: FAD binding domain-containing protein [Alphaproteobacteria bacterium]|nr:FAD binding domain-containing protein [Alphaproteobacteria bacterium]